LSEKGFPAGRKLYWDRSILPRVLEVVKEVEPKLEIRWDTRDAITLRIPGVSRSWAQWRTKDNKALDCRFIGKKGHLTLSQVETLGVSPTIHHHRADCDLLRINFQRTEQLHPDRLKEVLTEHLRGFREVFAKANK
jgi:hypothetical protein